MSKSQSKIPSPARSLGVITPRRPRTRRTLSTASPARSKATGRLSSVVEKFIKDDFVLSPMKRRSVLPDNTEIEAPRRASWWKRLEGSSRDVLEALDTNKMPDDMLVEEYEFEIEKDIQNQSVPESSDSESVASIVVPQKRLFNQKNQRQSKFADNMSSRESLGSTNNEDMSIEVAPKNIFNKGPRNKPVFPAALLNSTNKTINKTIEPEPAKRARPNLFGQAGTKRKNMFTDFVVSDSEEDSEVEHKIFGFNKNNNKRISLGTRYRRMPSLTPSMTTEIDVDDWILLPSSTMIGAQEVSRISTDDVNQVQEENQDGTLTGENESLNCNTNNQSTHKKSEIENDDNDKTLTNENIEDASEKNESKKSDKSHAQSKSKLNVSGKGKTLQNKSSTQTNAENVEIIEEVVVEKQQNIASNINLITVINAKSVEDKIAELHGEYVEKKENHQNTLLNRTKENLDIYKETETANQYSKGEQEIKASAEEQGVENVSKAASNVNRHEDNLPEKDKSEKGLEQSNEAQKSNSSYKEANRLNRDEDMDDLSKKDISVGNLEPGGEEQESQEYSKEKVDTNQDENMENASEEEIEPSAEEQETDDHSVENQTKQDEDIDNISEKEMETSADEEDYQEKIEESHENEDKEIDDVSENDNCEQPSTNDRDNQNDSNEESNENKDEDMEKMVWNQNDYDKASNTSDIEIYAEAKQNDEVVSNEKCNKMNEYDRTIDQKEIAKASGNLTNKSQLIVETVVDNEQIEENVVEETPNNFTHDTTGRNRKKETIVQSAEAVLLNMTNDNESFRPIGRSTTFRKSRSAYETMNRPSLAPVQESTLGSEGSRNSSTEGSEWDSHRTTRKTIRQTLGKEYTTRKSLRALVMEQSAKRQTVLYNKNKSTLEVKDNNASKINKTKNRTVLEDGNKTATIDITKNKTVSEDNKNPSTLNKTKTVLEYVNNKNASTINKTEDNTIIKDISDQHIRFRRTSNRNLSSNQSSSPKSPVHSTSTHHVPDPLISEHQVSYHKSLHDIKYPEVSEHISIREDSINLPVLENNDSGPEISMNASYGQGMSADTHHETSTGKYENSDAEKKENSGAKGDDVSRRNASVRSKSIHHSDQEILDYEASELEESEREFSETEVEQENSERDDSMQELVQDGEKENSESENEEVAEQSEIEEIEQENEEDSQQEIEAESDHDVSRRNASVRSKSIHHSDQEILDYKASELEDEESEQELSETEVDQENLERDDSMQELVQDGEKENSESENEEVAEQSEIEEIEQENEEDSQQEIEAESDHDVSRRNASVRSKSIHHSNQEILDYKASELEDEESEQELTETEVDQENFERDDSVQEFVQDEEKENSEPEESENEDVAEQSELEETEQENAEDSQQEIGLKSSFRTNSTPGVSRVVFDSQMMSVEEIDFGGVSGQTDNDISVQSERGPELSRSTLPCVSDPSLHEVSVGTKKSMLLMQMQKIAQQNMELTHKIREKVQKSLKAARNRSVMSPMPYYSIRRVTKEPRKPKKKPEPAGVPTDMLPKEFVEDLVYKPPKRFQPANAPWITKRLYKFLETKLEPRYDYRARVRAEELVQIIHSFTKLVRRRDEAPRQAIDELKREMARLGIVNTHHDFYQFFHDFMPREVRIKVNPDVVNNIPRPRNVFGEILPSRMAVE